MGEQIEREFTVHREPKGKARPRATRTGHVYTPGDTTSYEAIVRGEYQQAWPDSKPLIGDVQVYITAYFPIPESWSRKKKEQADRGEIRPTKKPDCDNIAKIICDALNGLAYKDDAQIVDLYVRKLYTVYLPKVTVVLYGETEE